MRKLILSAIFATLPLAGQAFPAKPKPHQDDAERFATKSMPAPCNFDSKALSGVIWPEFGNDRCKLADQGITINANYTSDTMFNVSGGLTRGGAYADSFGLDMTADLGKLIGLDGASVYMNFVDRNGTDLSVTHVGNQFSLQQVYGNETFIVDSVYLQYEVDAYDIAIKAGRMNAGDDFMSDPIYGYFVSNAFDGNPIGVFFNMPFSAYPNAQWGAHGQFEPIPGILGQFAVYNNNSDSQAGRYNGTAWSFTSDNGVLLVTEWDFLSQDVSNNLMPAKYGIGFLYVTGDNQTKFNTSTRVRGNYGVYYQLSQQITQPNGPKTQQGLSVFFTMQYFPKDRNTFEYFFDGGATYMGLIPGRPDDVLSIGWAYGKYSADLAAYQSSNGIASQNFESVVELGYRIQATPWLYVQPDTQYIIRPSGTGNIPNAWAIGAQVGATF